MRGMSLQVPILIGSVRRGRQSPKVARTDRFLDEVLWWTQATFRQAELSLASR